MDNKLQAILDMYESFGPDVTRSTSEWDDLSCDEQMLIEQAY